MKALKRTFKVGESVKFYSRAGLKRTRLEVTGKITAIKDVKYAEGRKRMAFLAVSRGCKYHKLTKKTAVRVFLSNCF